MRILDELAGTGERWGLGMMSLLLAVVRLWQGRTVEALDRAAAAQREFHDMGDGTGEFRALGTIVRGRVAIGRVEDGVAALRAAAANAPTVSEAAVNQVEALTTNIAVQVGDPSLAPAHPSPDPPLEGSPGWAEVSSQLGLLALQEGRTTEAVEQLDAADRLAVGPNRRAFSAATLALAYAAAGRPDDADRVAADVAGLASTYLDRSYAAAARGFAAAQRGSADDAEAAFATAMAEVDGTDDVLSQAVIRLAYGRALEALGGPLATPVLVDARTRLNAIGISAQGWDTAFSLAAHPEATPQGQRLVDRPG